MGARALSWHFYSRIIQFKIFTVICATHCVMLKHQLLRSLSLRQSPSLREGREFKKATSDTFNIPSWVLKLFHWVRATAKINSYSLPSQAALLCSCFSGTDTEPWGAHISQSFPHALSSSSKDVQQLSFTKSSWKHIMRCKGITLGYCLWRHRF